MRCSPSIDGVERAANDLRALLDEARGQRRSLQSLAAKVGNIEVVEQAAIAGALSADLLADPAQALDAARRTAERLNLLAPEAERSWQGEIVTGSSGIDGLVLAPHPAGGRRAAPDRGGLAAVERGAPARRRPRQTARGL